MNAFSECLQPFGEGKLYSLPHLERMGLGQISRLPVCLRVVLESVVRHCDGRRVRQRGGDPPHAPPWTRGPMHVQEAHVRKLAAWTPGAERTDEIPFVVARVLLQDFTGVPLLVDLAAMRSAVARMGRDTALVEPLVPVDLVIDHSVQVDVSRSPDSFRQNMELEFHRNASRYQFLKWGMQAFEGLRVVPPGIGICHQVNLESLAQVVMEQDGVYYPDSLVGTDSHTTMINGLGVVGWGVGGIEAEAAMLGQPVYLLTPDVVGVHLSGALREGVTATDLVLRVTEMLRAAKVVGKFVEFFGRGAASLSVPDRATLANMAPEYGATMGYFPIDEETCAYLLATGRPREQVERVRAYLQAQAMFGVPRAGDCDYSQVLELSLDSIEASVAGPRRPQDRIPLARLKEDFCELLCKRPAEGGYGKTPEDLELRYHVEAGAPTPLAGGGEQRNESLPVAREADVSHKDTSVWTETEMVNNRPTPTIRSENEFENGHRLLAQGDVLIAAITSCTNTSNPSVMLAAGLLAKKAVERGLRVRKWVKSSLAPGSRVVTDYLERTGLQPYLDELGFNLVGYGCTTCIGNSGPLDPNLEQTVQDRDVVAAAVLSGNRNFEARVHQSIRANFLMSPPLVVAFALAGRVTIDLLREPLGQDREGKDVYLRDLWPTSSEVAAMARAAFDPDSYRRLYADAAHQNPLWDAIPSTPGHTYEWNENSTYIAEPPYFQTPPPSAGDLEGARALAIFGDSVTTDHISPAGAIKASSPAGVYLQERGVQPQEFNSYGSRRGHHEVMLRGTFANVRIRNQMVPGVEGGVTRHQPSGERMSIFEAAARYQREGVPLLIFAGQEYGTGSSRDWAAKGTGLLGVRAVIAESFERIHRSNLIGMGVLPCQFVAERPTLDGSETFALRGLGQIRPGQPVELLIRRPDGQEETVPLRLRIDTPIEADYYRQGGILPYVLQQLVGEPMVDPARIG